jgi:hypothetical protein
MESKSAFSASSKILVFAVLGFLPVFVSLAAHASPQAQPDTPAAPKQKQVVFETPQEAADALIQAAEQFDVAALNAIFGQEGAGFVSTGDPAQDKTKSVAFAAKAHEKNSVAMDPKNSTRAVLWVGDDDWPFPVPIVKQNGKWYFDAKAGHAEIVFRRIGANELDAIEICRGYVDAQKEYALKQHDNSNVNQYAQRIISTPGRHDGLAWQDANGVWSGAVGEDIAKALQQGAAQAGQPYHGYYFKVLKGQGPAAPLGEMDFVVEGVMIGGFGLIATPAQYRLTGVDTFIVSHEGVVYQKDLGPNSLDIFKDINRYNPDRTWRRTDDDW